MKNYPSDGLPFSVSTRSWEELNESERSFFCFQIVVNHTLSWACCFHHEDIIIFGHNYKIRRSR